MANIRYTDADGTIRYAHSTQAGSDPDPDLSHEDVVAGLTTLDAKTPILGQALAAASVPVVLPTAQITTLTPPAAITGFATSTGQTATNAALGAQSDPEAAGDGTLVALLKRLRTLLAAGLPAALGQGTKAQSLPVTLASNEDLLANVGATNETAAASDAAVSGLNGLLRRLLGRMRPRQSSTATLTNVSASVTSVTLLAANAARVGVIVWNDSTATLYIKYGATASATSTSVRMEPDSYWEMPEPVHPGIMDAIWTAATGAARVTESI